MQAEVGRFAFWRCPFLSLGGRGILTSLAHLSETGWDQSRQGEDRAWLDFRLKNRGECRHLHLLPQPVGTGVLKARTAPWIPQQVR